MKGILIVFALAVFVQAQLEQCYEDANVDAYTIGYIDYFHDFDYADDAIKMFFDCSLKLAGFIDENGEFDTKKFLNSSAFELNDTNIHKIDICINDTRNEDANIGWTAYKCLGYFDMTDDQKAFESCLKEINPNRAKIINMILKSSLPNEDPELETFLKCYFNKHGWLDNKGKLTSELVSKNVTVKSRKIDNADNAVCEKKIYKVITNQVAVNFFTCLKKYGQNNDNGN